MPTYETIFIAHPGITVEDENETVNLLSRVITDSGGALAIADRMGRRKLAYPINKHDEGIYVRLLYDSGADVPKELERRIRLSDSILRGLTVRLTEEWAEHAKEQAVRDAERRAEAEAAEAAAREAAEAAENEPADEERPASEGGVRAEAGPVAEAREPGYEETADGQDEEPDAEIEGDEDDGY